MIFSVLFSSCTYFFSVPKKSNLFDKMCFRTPEKLMILTLITFTKGEKPPVKSFDQQLSSKFICWIETNKLYHGCVNLKSLECWAKNNFCWDPKAEA